MLQKPEVRGVKTARITVNEAFYLATVGGGQALSLPIGKLEKGMLGMFKLLIQACHKHESLKIQESLLDIFQKSYI